MASICAEALSSIHALRKEFGEPFTVSLGLTLGWLVEIFSDCVKVVVPPALGNIKI